MEEEKKKKELETAKEELADINQRLKAANAAYDKWNDKLEGEGLSEEERTFYERRADAAERQQAELRKQKELQQQRVSELEKKSPPLAFVEYSPEVYVETGNFLARQLVLRNRTSLPPGFISFGERLWAADDEVTSLYNRDWYMENAGPLISSFNNEVRRIIIVAGNKGLGKTVFSFILMVEALKEGFIVAYQNANDRFWIFGEKAKQRDDLYEVAKVFEMNGYEACLAPGVYRVVLEKEVAVFISLVKLRQVIYIVDVGEHFNEFIESQGPKIIISSPNSGKLKRIGEAYRPRYVYMPLWSWEELIKLNENLPTRTESPNDRFVRQDLGDLQFLFGRFGGVPRILFENEPVLNKLQALDRVLEDTPLDDWKRLFSCTNFSALPRNIPGMLVHITERMDIPGSCKIEFASNDILLLVIRRYFNHCRQDLITFLNATTPSRMVSAMRGELVEECMHQGFTAPNEERVHGLEIRKLSGNTQFHPLQLPLMTRKFFRFLNMVDFTEIELNEYYQPLICNFPAVDAITLMERKVFDGPTATGLCGVGFQATVSKKKRKGVSREELSRVRDKLRMLTKNPMLPLYLVFVTTPDGLSSRQVLGRPKLPEDDEYVQFVIRGISFEAMSGITLPNEDGLDELDPDNDVDEE